MIDVSIILVNFNTRDLTLNSINSIYEHTKNVSFEIIVVDNNSSDGSVDEINKFFPKVITISNKANVGFGSANNIGVKKAKGLYCLFLNTDTLLLNNAVEGLYKKISDSVFDVVCGNLYYEDETEATSYSKQFPGIAFEIKSLFFNFNDKIKFFNNVHNFSETNIRIKGSLSGADFMLKKELFSKVGGFDEDYFLYYEETDLFYRMYKMGYKFGSIPSARIKHLEGASERVRKVTLERTFRSREIFFKKHHSKIYKKVCDLLFMLTCYTRIFAFKLLGKKISVENWLEIKNTFKDRSKI